MNRLIELIKYGFYGGLTTAINLILFFVFTQLGIQYIIANTVSYIIAVILNYFLNQLFVFKTSKKEKKEQRKEFISFFIVRIGSLFLDNILFYVVVDILNVNLYIGRIALSLFIILVTFVINKKLVFKNS